jgi:uncharacterized alpha-E superfamily protein
MLSRTADNLFWLARYMERAENMARILDGTRQQPWMPCSSSWCSMLTTRRRS